MSEEQPPEQVRTAELIGALCLATDLGMGFPYEHGFHATLMAMRLCEVLEVDSQTAFETYYASMLAYTGCTTDAAIAVEIFAGPQTEHVVPALWGSARERLTGVIRALPPPEVGSVKRLAEIARRFPAMVGIAEEHQTALCEVGEMLARRLGLPPSVSGLFRLLTERWDGKSMLKRAAGDEIPQSLRIALLARDAAYQRLTGGPEHARRVIAERSGGGFDPAVVEAFLESAEDVFAAADTTGSAWSAVMAAEPTPHRKHEEERIDEALGAMGHFADLMSPSLAGHSSGVAELAARAAAIAGFSDDETTFVRRAALVHDLGRVGIESRIWERRGPLSSDDWEKVRLHPYHGQRVMAPAPFLESLAVVACDHHERLDGSGYPRAVPAVVQSRPGRLLAAADSLHAMIEPRPHRPPLGLSEAAAVLTDASSGGLFDHAMTSAVIEAAGYSAPEIPAPAGLTRRECEVLGLAARGLQTKQIARRLEISPKTADAHIQNVYRKIDVSTRAAATLFAMEHGLVHSGEFPIHD